MKDFGEDSCSEVLKHHGFGHERIHSAMNRGLYRHRIFTLDDPTKTVAYMRCDESWVWISYGCDLNKVPKECRPA